MEQSGGRLIECSPEPSAFAALSSSLAKLLAEGQRGHEVRTKGLALLVRWPRQRFQVTGMGRGEGAVRRDEWEEVNKHRRSAARADGWRTTRRADGDESTQGPRLCPSRRWLARSLARSIHLSFLPSPPHRSPNHLDSLIDSLLLAIRAATTQCQVSTSPLLGLRRVEAETCVTGDEREMAQLRLIRSSDAHPSYAFSSSNKTVHRRHRLRVLERREAEGPFNTVASSSVTVRTATRHQAFEALGEMC